MMLNSLVDKNASQFLIGCIFLLLFSDPNHVITQPKKVLSFEDTKQRAWQWKKAIEGLQNR